MVQTVEHKCDQICAACGKELLFGQNVYLLQIVNAPTASIHAMALLRN